MSEDGHSGTRRDYLQLLVGTGVLTGISGCNALNSDSSSPSDTRTESTDRTTQTSTRSPTPDRAPQIISHSATPQQSGQELAFTLEAEDDTDLSTVSVTYGDKVWDRENIDGTRIDESGTFTGLAASSNEDGRVQYLARDGAGQETRAEATPDETAPQLPVFSVAPTETAGEVTLTIRGSDETGLAKVSLRINGQTVLQQSLAGQTEFNIDSAIDISSTAESGVSNTVTGHVADWNGNRTEKSIESYVRKYEILEDTRFDIVGHYVPFGSDPRGCIDNGGEDIRRPDIGNYEPPFPDEVVNQHIDQMTGGGVGKVEIQYDWPGHQLRISEFMDAALINQTQVYPSLGPNTFSSRENMSWKDDVVPSDAEFLKETILSSESAATHDGHPMLKIWGAHWLANDNGGAGKLKDEWGSYENFVDDLRSHYTVDGNEPFLIFSRGSAGVHWFHDTEELNALTSQFDAVDTWTSLTNDHVGETYRWQQVMEDVKETWQGQREFCDDQGLEFIPTVFPGFNDIGNQCWDGGRFIPRNPDRFRELLQLATEFETMNQITIASWNDWTEGHQIEPGKLKAWDYREEGYQVEDYGTTYLDIIRDFQTSETGTTNGGL